MWFQRRQPLTVAIISATVRSARRTEKRADLLRTANQFQTSALAFSDRRSSNLRVAASNYRQRSATDVVRSGSARAFDKSAVSPRQQFGLLQASFAATSGINFDCTENSRAWGEAIIASDGRQQIEEKAYHKIGFNRSVSFEFVELRRQRRCDFIEPHPFARAGKPTRHHELRKD